MNSLANGKILENTDFQDLHISFAPSIWVVLLVLCYIKKE